MCERIFFSFKLKVGIKEVGIKSIILKGIGVYDVLFYFLKWFERILV